MLTSALPATDPMALWIPTSVAPARYAPSAKRRCRNCASHYNLMARLQWRVFAATEANYDFCLARYLANGAPDIQFWQRGRGFITPIGTSQDHGRAMPFNPMGGSSSPEAATWV